MIRLLLFINMIYCMSYMTLNRRALALDGTCTGEHGKLDLCFSNG